MALPWRWQRFNVTNPTINLLKISSLAYSSFSSASIFAVTLIASGCIGNHNGMWSWRLRWRANGNWDKLFSGFWIWSAIMRWMAAGVSLKLIKHINRADGLTLKSSIWLSLDNSCRERRGKNKKKRNYKRNYSQSRTTSNAADLQKLLFKFSAFIASVVLLRV